MTTNVLALSGDAGPGGDRRVHKTVAIALIAWFLIVGILGGNGAFVGPPGKPPIAIAIGVASPLLLFLAWMRYSEAFKAFVLSLDLRLIAGIQAWRFAGLGFLDLYAHNVLPAIFALPAGLGDMAIAIAAPWIMLKLARRPDFATSKAFLRWNLLGILDLLVAISIGAINTLFTTGAPTEISTGPMATLPLLFVPAFLVPLFLMLHIAALLQRRKLLNEPAYVPSV